MITNGPIGVIDIGSNSGRLVVYAKAACGHLELLEDARVPLRLARDLRQGPALSAEAVERTMGALREFQSIAHGAGAERIVVVGTASMREATNGQELIERIRGEVGMDVEILDGLAEARYSYLGAIHGLPVQNGAALDIGGGSLEITRFRQRTGVASWMLPLGALRTSVEFLASDPPTNKEMRKLRRHLERSLSEAGITALESGETLVGTGGTIRNLAKIDRRARPYPISRLHGYTVPLDGVRQIVEQLGALDQASRAETPGLNADRADSIVAGAITAQVVMETMGASELLVAGQGLREGIAFAAFGDPVPDPAAVRRASIAALVRHFHAWDARRAGRRQAILNRLVVALEPDMPDETREILETAATVLDIGRSVDYYNRLVHTASIVAVADLNGFSHRALALLSAVMLEADRRGSAASRFGVLLTDDDVALIGRAAVLLTLADEFERRYADNTDTDTDLETSVRVDQRGNDVVLYGPPLSDYSGAKLADRFARAYERRLILRDDGDATGEPEAQQ